VLLLDPSSFAIVLVLAAQVQRRPRVADIRNVVMPLGTLTVIVLAVILSGITTATESAAVGAAGAFLASASPSAGSHLAMRSGLSPRAGSDEGTPLPI
jgi:TRAP-type mannitol/chloroaromatic compound transport system permease large subunit